MVNHMKTTLNLAEELMSAAKQRALDRGTTLTRVVEEALRAHLFGSVAREEAEPYAFEFPVVHDERPPTVDVTNRAALYEMWFAEENQRLYGKRKRK